jgi:hypothetical protein
MLQPINHYFVTTLALTTLPSGASILAKLNALAETDVLMKEVLIQLRGNGVELRHPKTQATLTALQTNGVFTPEEVAEINTLGMEDVPDQPAPVQTEVRYYKKVDGVTVDATEQCYLNCTDGMTWKTEVPIAN